MAEVLSTASSYAIDKIVQDSDIGEIFTLYDLLKDISDAISKTTRISGEGISYDYSITTTVQFKFVNGKGMSDMTKILAYRATRCLTYVTVQSAGFIYADGVALPSGFHKEDTTVSLPNGYNSNINAIRYFLDNNSSAWAYVDSININILEGDPIYVYPVQPLTPIEVY